MPNLLFLPEQLQHLRNLPFEKKKLKLELDFQPKGEGYHNNSTASNSTKIVKWVISGMIILKPDSKSSDIKKTDVKYSSSVLLSKHEFQYSDPHSDLLLLCGNQSQQLLKKKNFFSFLTMHSLHSYQCKL